MTTKSLVKFSTIALVVFFVGGYSLYEARALIEGPVIHVSRPENGSMQMTPLIEVAGNVENVSAIFLNDRAITMDTSGNFSEKMLLSPGYNVVKLKIADKFGREKEEYLELMYSPTQAIGAKHSIDIN